MSWADSDLHEQPGLPAPCKVAAGSLAVLSPSTSCQDAAAPAAQEPRSVGGSWRSVGQENAEKGLHGISTVVNGSSSIDYSDHERVFACFSVLEHASFSVLSLHT